MSLFWRVFLLNAAVLTAATAWLILSPATVSTPVAPSEFVVLLLGLAAMLVVNLVLLRLGFTPLKRLIRAMTSVDLLRPGTARPKVSGHGEVAELITTFHAMLDRLEQERASSNARALFAQEAERRRIARELHDEVGQSLTAVLLELKQVAEQVPESTAPAVRQVQEITRSSLDEIRRIARRLRPGVLEELGVASAIRSLASEVTGPAVRCRVDGELPELDEQSELVLYRVAQESITNVVRHAQAQHLDVVLSGDADGVRLCVHDDGQGIGVAVEGAGIRGMRERALLIGAELTVADAAGGGTQVVLELPKGTSS